MGELAKSAASLRIFGDDLEPEALSELLGADPTRSYRKGDDISRRQGQKRIARFGAWSREADRREPGDLGAQIREILRPLTSDLAVWRQINRAYRCDVFTGLFLDDWNEGISISPDVLSMLGERGLKLDLDIYSGEDDDD